MPISDIFFVLIRWTHAVSATIWIGGSLFYLFVVRPAQSKSLQNDSVFNLNLAIEFRTIVNVSIVVLLATGVILAFDRLSTQVQTNYIMTLGFKSALSAWMFLNVWDLRKSSQLTKTHDPKSRNKTNLVARIGKIILGYESIVVIGTLIYLLSDILKLMFEKTLMGH